jgi:anti-sigma regulatory factor (Ser/Thr protein kinase)
VTPAGAYGWSIRIEIERDVSSGLTLVSLDGELTWSCVGAVRSALGKCLVERPLGVIADLSQMQVRNRVLLTVFNAARREARLPPAVAFALAAEGSLYLRLRRQRADIPVYPGVVAATEAVRHGLAHACWRAVKLPPSIDAPIQARNFIGDACLEWRVPQLLHPARLIVSELVTNAVEHAGTSIDLTVSLRSPYLHLGVRDGDTTPPQMRFQPSADPATLDDRGLGLRLVDRTATAWGFISTEHGKIVWATMRAEPIGT